MYNSVNKAPPVAAVSSYVRATSQTLHKTLGSKDSSGEVMSANHREKKRYFHRGVKKAL